MFKDTITINILDKPEYEPISEAQTLTGRWRFHEIALHIKKDKRDTQTAKRWNATWTFP